MAAAVPPDALGCMRGPPGGVAVRLLPPGQRLDLLGLRAEPFRSHPTLSVPARRAVRAFSVARVAAGDPPGIARPPLPAAASDGPVDARDHLHHPLAGAVRAAPAGVRG